MGQEIRSRVQEGRKDTGLHLGHERVMQISTLRPRRESALVGVAFGHCFQS